MPDQQFDDAAATGYAALLLLATADALDPDENSAAFAMANLSETTGQPLDLAAGAIMATTMIAGAGDLTAETLRDAAARYEQLAQEGATP